jgi:carboxyl-terminal processing protease
MSTTRGHYWGEILLAVAAVFCPATIARAQAPVANTEVALPDPERLLTTGRQLENERKWGAAATHYEEAAKQFPERTELQERLTIARAHCDVERRYGDNSFLGTVERLTPRQALDLYEEVLSKIQTHHYQAPDFDRLVRRGMLNLEVGLTEPAFRGRYLKSVDEPVVKSVRLELAEFIGSRRVSDRSLARDTANSAAGLLANRLNIPPTVALLEFACGAANGLDDYSGFLTEGQVEEVFSQIEGNFVGLGVELKADNGSLLIVSVIPNGPAARGGLKAGERIVAVDGKTTQEVSSDTAADMLRGEEGTVVAVTTVTATGTQRTLRLVRQRVEVPSVEEAKIVDKANGVAYFKLTSFQKTTARDVDAALWRLHGEGMRSLIIDLRGNPGGLLKAAVDVADRFVNEGLIVATRGRSPREDFDHRGQTAGTWRVPLVILIDRDSASASEILAGAIRDHRRGTVIGERSYGKGSVQGIFPLGSSLAGIRLTTAQWYTPAGHAISGHGIDPDVVVRTVAKPTAEGRVPGANPTDDAILNAGLQAARNQIAKRPSVAEQLRQSQK